MRSATGSGNVEKNATWETFCMQRQEVDRSGLEGARLAFDFLVGYFSIFFIIFPKSKSPRVEHATSLLGLQNWYSLGPLLHLSFRPVI